MMFFRNKYVVYDENNKVVIITHHKHLAINHARRILNGRQRPKTS
jgi:hypothetical protein